MIYDLLHGIFPKKSPGGVLRKSCSEELHKTYEKHLRCILFSNNIAGCSPAISLKIENMKKFGPLLQGGRAFRGNC